MSISLNNHESRIKALESSGKVSEVSLTNPGYIKFSNGLIINFGTSGGVNKTFSFKKPFTSTIISATSSRLDGGGYEHSPILGSLTNSGLYVQCRGYQNESKSANIGIIAIGYLISYRILNYAYACKNLLFTPLRKFGGVK